MHCTIRSHCCYLIRLLWSYSHAFFMQSLWIMDASTQQNDWQSGWEWFYVKCLADRWILPCNNHAWLSIIHIPCKSSAWHIDWMHHSGCTTVNSEHLHNIQEDDWWLMLYDYPLIATETDCAVPRLRSYLPMQIIKFCLWLLPLSSHTMHPASWDLMFLSQDLGLDFLG